MNRDNRFYCENCKNEVKANARVCPHCGRWFTAVKCPQCSYTAGGEEFVRGCPRCGYNGKDLRDPADLVDITNEFGLHKPKKRSNTAFFPIAAVTLVVAFIVLVIVYLNLN